VNRDSFVEKTYKLFSRIPSVMLNVTSSEKTAFTIVKISGVTASECPSSVRFVVAASRQYLLAGALQSYLGLGLIFISFT